MSDSGRTDGTPPPEGWAAPPPPGGTPPPGATPPGAGQQPPQQQPYPQQQPGQQQPGQQPYPQQQPYPGQQSYPGQQPYAAPPGQGSGYGGVGKRFGARIIDSLLVGIPLSIIVSVIPGISTAGFIGTAIISAGAFAYYLFMETSKGATFGKQWLGMRVVDQASGASPITMDASLRRNAWMLLGVLGGIPIIGLISSLASLVIVIFIATTISSSPVNQGWHDKLAKTLVVDRPS